jgi:hypothetical protein
MKAVSNATPLRYLIAIKQEHFIITETALD